MGYECTANCQIEVSPGVFKYVIAGQTDFIKGVPFKHKHIKPIARKYFKLTGDAIKEDLKDKSNIAQALKKRKISFSRAASTSALAKILAKDNSSRGIADLGALNIDSKVRHFADKRILDAKARLDELYEIAVGEDLPYNEDDSLDDLNRMIEAKEADLIGGDIDPDTELTNDQIRAKLDGLNIKHKPNDNKATLQALLDRGSAG